MPIHDWSRVSAGTFHHFHLLWIGAISDALNGGLLPPDYYAMAEQIVGSFGPDVVALQSSNGNGTNGPAATSTASGMVSLLVTAPHVRVSATTEMDQYVQKQRNLVIRHGSDDRIIALIEIVSPGNKSNRHAIRSFLDEAAEALFRGYHLLILDLHPPTPRDPQGIHGALWEEISDDSYRAPADRPLTLAAYSAGDLKMAFVEPTAVGEVLIEMPLFLEPQEYINVPLEATYQAAYRGVPARWKRVLEGMTA